MPYQQRFEHMNVTVFDRMPKVKEKDAIGNQLGLRYKDIIITPKASHPYVTSKRFFTLTRFPEHVPTDIVSILVDNIVLLKYGDEVVEDITAGHCPSFHCDIVTLSMWSCLLGDRYDVTLILDHDFVF